MDANKKRSALERITWTALILVAVYATHTGTNWYRNYQQYKTAAETSESRITSLQVEKSNTLQELEKAQAEIERLKSIPLR